MPPDRIPRKLRITACVLLAASLACAQRPGFKVPEKAANRVFWWSSSAPMTKAINRLAPLAVRSTEVLQNHLEYVEQAILKAVAIKTRSEDDIIQICNRIDKRWTPEVTKQFGHRGLADPDVSCITSVSGARMYRDEDPPYTLDELYDASYQRGLSIMAHIKEISASFADIKTNYTEPDFVFNCPYNTHYANCVLHPTAGFRSGEHWHISTTIHNRPKELKVFDTGEHQRSLVIELHRVVGGQLNTTLKMRLPVWRNDTKKKEIRNDTTTIMASSTRGGQPSNFGNIFIYTNEAIVETLDEMDHFVQQAADALTPSSIAILALPLCLNLVPIACFSTVGSVGFFFYILMTDILTSIPLAIKGTELIFIRAQRHRTVVARMSTAIDGNGRKPEAAGAAIWAAECRAKESVGNAGVTLLVFSLGFLILGIVLEVVARRYAAKRQQAKSFWTKEGSFFFAEFGWDHKHERAHRALNTPGAYHQELDEIWYDRYSFSS